VSCVSCRYRRTRCVHQSLSALHDKIGVKDEWFGRSLGSKLLPLSRYVIIQLTQNSCAAKAHNDKQQKIRHMEAKRSRAVVRTVGMEGFSLGWHEVGLPRVDMGKLINVDQIARLRCIHCS